MTAPAIYLNGATLMSTPTDRVLAIAREAGYAGVEARAERLLQNPDEVRATAAAAVAGDVLTLNGISLCLRPDGSMDRASLETDLSPRLEICKALRAPYLLAVPPRAPGVQVQAAMLGIRKALELVRDRALGAGVRVAFEFLGFADCPVNSPTLAAELVDRVDGIEVVLDSCHWHATGAGSLSGRYPVNRLALVHLNDAPAKPPTEIEDADRVLPGEGVIALPQLIEDLRSDGFSGPWSLETFNRSYWGDDPEHVARQGLAAVERFFPS